jgi:SAM-dependent methyltransferase
MRDTDKDWKHIAATEPYYGVMVSPENKKSFLQDSGFENFYATGISDIDHAVERLRGLGVEFPVKSALDFGCGVGRLTVPMTKMANYVTGCDISGHMLKEARTALERSGAKNYLLTEGLGDDETFDWINCFIVFQHIPPARGYALLADLMGRLRPFGAISMHVTLHRLNEKRPVFFDGNRCEMLVDDTTPRVGEISMYDYDLNRVLAIMKYLGGTREWSLQDTDHGGSIGAWIFSRRVE